MDSQAVLDVGKLEEFKQLSESLRFYMTLVVSTSTLAIAGTSLVLGNVLKKDGSVGLHSLALLLPAAMCAWLGLGFRNWVPSAVELRDRLHVLGRGLGFGLGPRGGVLVGTLESLGALFVAAAVALALVPLVVGYRWFRPIVGEWWSRRAAWRGGASMPWRRLDGRAHARTFGHSLRARRSVAQARQLAHAKKHRRR